MEKVHGDLEAGHTWAEEEKEGWNASLAEANFTLIGLCTSSSPLPQIADLATTTLETSTALTIQLYTFDPSCLTCTRPTSISHLPLLNFHGRVLEYPKLSRYVAPLQQRLP